MKQKRTKQGQINPLCSTQLSLFQRNNMVNLCICSMQVHQSKFSLCFSSSSSLLPSPPLVFPANLPQWLLPHACRFYVPLFVSQTAPSRSRSWPRCCSWPPFAGPGRGTCTCPRPGTGTCTRWPRRAGCCGDETEEGSVRRGPAVRRGLRGGGQTEGAAHLFIKLTM